MRAADVPSKGIRQSYRPHFPESCNLMKIEQEEVLVYVR